MPRLRQLARTSKPIHHTHQQTKHAVPFVLHRFLVPRQKRLRNRQGADGLGIVIAPNKQHHTAQCYGHRKDKTGPAQSCQPQRLTYLAKLDQEHEEPRDMMIEEGIGLAFRRSFPWGHGKSMMGLCMIRGPKLVRKADTTGASQPASDGKTNRHSARSRFIHKIVLHAILGMC